MIDKDSIIKVYLVETVVDERGRTGTKVGVTVSIAEAENMAKGQGYFGSEGRISERYALILDKKDPNAVFLLESPVSYPLGVNLPKREAEKRKAAYAKLSPEERRLLGIKE
jgi:hypothetical protein